MAFRIQVDYNIAKEKAEAVTDAPLELAAVACEKGLAVWDWAWKFWNPRYSLDHPEMKPSKRMIPASILYNDADRREFIGAGAAAGLAVSFPTPSCFSFSFLLAQDLPWLPQQHCYGVVSTIKMFGSPTIAFPQASGKLLVKAPGDRQEFIGTRAAAGLAVSLLISPFLLLFLLLSLLKTCHCSLSNIDHLGVEQSSILLPSNTTFSSIRDPAGPNLRLRRQCACPIIAQQKRLLPLHILGVHGAGLFHAAR